jgi:hypothetical protein
MLLLPHYDTWKNQKICSFYPVPYPANFDEV